MTEQVDRLFKRKPHIFSKSYIQEVEKLEEYWNNKISKYKKDL